MPTYKVQSTHPEDLANGRVVASGDDVTLTDSQAEDPHNKRLIDEGILVEFEAPKSRKEGK